MANGVSIIPKHGIIMPEEVYNEKLLRGEIRSEGVRLSSEDVSKLGNIGDIQQLDNNINMQNNNPPPVYIPPASSDETIRSNNMSWDELTNLQNTDK